VSNDTPMKKYPGLLIVALLLLACSCPATIPGLVTPPTTTQPPFTDTPAPTRTPTPIPTPTVNAPAQAFGKSILVALASRQSDIFDDFSRDRGWYGTADGIDSADEVSVQDGVIRAAGDGPRGSTRMVTSQIVGLRNYAVTVEAVFLDSGSSNRDREIGICWWPGDDKGERFLLRENGTFEGGTCHDEGCPAFIRGRIAPIPTGEVVFLTLIHLRGESVVYVNDVPLAYHKLAITDYMSGFSLCPHTYDGKPSDIVYDNLRVWNLDLVPGLP
jgi:hypothetical protein